MKPSEHLIQYFSFIKIKEWTENQNLLTTYYSKKSFIKILLISVPCIFSEDSNPVLFLLLIQEHLTPCSAKQISISYEISNLKK